MFVYKHAETIAMLNFNWNGRDSDRSREKGFLIIVALENIYSKNFLKFSNPKFVVKILT